HDDARRAPVEARPDEEEAAALRVVDEGHATLEHPPVAVGPARHARPARERSPAVRQRCPAARQRSKNLAPRQRRHAAVGLPARAETLEQGRNRGLSDDERRQRAPSTRELLHRHRVRDEVEAEAALLWRDEGPEDAELCDSRHEPLGVAPGGLLIMDGRRDLLVDELSHREDDLTPLRGLVLAGGERPELLAVPLE